MTNSKHINKDEVLNDLTRNPRHTPGPWTIHHENNKSDNTLSVYVPYGENGNKHGIAYVAPQPFYKDCQLENARLIAASPDLLLQLQNAISTIEWALNDPEKFRATVALTLPELKQAIAKAKGE